MNAENENKKAYNLQIEILRGMTPEKRLRIAWELFQDACKLKAAWLKKVHPDWSKERIEEAVKRIFLHAHT